jgi:AraC family transcriptional regulator, arabinose operon regulatory protein
MRILRLYIYYARRTAMKKMVFPMITEFDTSLPYYIIGVGCSYEQEHINRPNGFPYYQWIQCRHGSGELKIGERTYTVSENQGMLLFPEEAHEYSALSESWEVDWIIFGGENVGKFIQQTAKIKNSGVYFITRPHGVSDKIVRIYEAENTGNPTKKTEASRMAYEILMDLLEFIADKTDNSISNKYNRLKPVLQYIEEYYNKPLALTELSDVAGITPQHLCHSFKKITSHTVTEYINMVRIRKSKELIIQHRDMQMKEIAIMAGFQDVSYFSAIFRKLVNLSPSEFRNLMQ